MNFAYFVSSRLGKNKLQNSFSAIGTRIAIAGIAIGLAIMLVAFAILQGFQEKIKQKIFSFGGHILITKRNLKNSFQEEPLSLNTPLATIHRKKPPIAHFQTFAHQAGILKTDSEVMGVVLKGIGKDYDSTYFADNMKSGNFVRPALPQGELDIVVSQKIANKLNLKLRDSVLMFFVQDPPRFRKLYIRGIYETGMEDFDEKIIFGNIRLVQRLKNWADSLVGGYEIRVKNFEALDSTSVFDVLEYAEHYMRAETITQRFMGVFEWLLLLDKNVQIFLGLILLVASFNIISILLILIMERVQMIGVLKAIGASSFKISQIFIYQGLLLVAKGMLWGNAIGLGFCALQYYTKLLPLDPENYYMNSVPIAWNWLVILLVNIVTFLIINLVLLLPSIAIARIKPLHAIKFD